METIGTDSCPMHPGESIFLVFSGEKKNGEQPLIKLFQAQDLIFQQVAAK